MGVDDVTKVGIFSLGDLTITTAGTATGTPVTELDGVKSITVQLRFQYGSGGTNARAYLQTSLDQGETWIDIACRLFTTASGTKVFTLSTDAGSSSIDPSDGALTDDTLVQGVLGDRFRIKIISTGTYATQTLLSSRIAAR